MIRSMCDEEGVKHSEEELLEESDDRSFDWRFWGGLLSGGVFLLGIVAGFMWMASNWFDHPTSWPDVAIVGIVVAGLVGGRFATSRG